jgi:hypothetical protein
MVVCWGQCPAQSFAAVVCRGAHETIGRPSVLRTCAGFVSWTAIVCRGPMQPLGSAVRRTVGRGSVLGPVSYAKLCCCCVPWGPCNQRVVQSVRRVSGSVLRPCPAQGLAAAAFSGAHATTGQRSMLDGETVPGTGEVARFPVETLGTHKDGNTM